MVIIVKYYQYNGFLFDLHRFETNNNIGPALLMSGGDEAAYVTPWGVGTASKTQSYAHTCAHTHFRCGRLACEDKLPTSCVHLA